MRSTQLSSLDLNLLLVADALLESRSVTETAEMVHLSQPAVSRALGRLRAQLAEELMVRDGRGMVLTPFAEGLRPRLRHALMTLEQALFVQPTFEPATANGSLTIAAQDFAAFSFLPDAASRFATAAPNVDVVLVRYREPFEALLETNEVDVAIGPRASGKSWIRSKSLFEGGWVCVGRKGHAFVKRPTLRAFTAASHVLVSPDGRGTGVVDEALSRHGRSRRVRVRVPDFSAALALAAQSDLLVVVPEALAASAVRVLPLAARPVPFPLPRCEIFLSWHVAHDEDPRHAWLRKQLGRVPRRGPSAAG